MKVAMKTDLGKSRDINEDNCIHCSLGRWELLVVADGMGGHNAGEVASIIAVNSIRDYIREKVNEDTKIEELECIVKDAILKANGDIYKKSLDDSRYAGMGTTATVAMVSEGISIIGHVGDSRAYLLKDNKLIKITDDHSLVAELLKNGTITEVEAKNHPQKNIITRALGTDEKLEVDIKTIEFNSGNIMVLCTDGLTNMVCDEEIESVLVNTEDTEKAVQELVDLANEKGGHDNITVILARSVCQHSEVRL